VVRLLGDVGAAVAPCRPLTGERSRPSCASGVGISRPPVQPAAGIPAGQNGHSTTIIMQINQGLSVTSYPIQMVQFHVGCGAGKRLRRVILAWIPALTRRCAVFYSNVFSSSVVFGRLFGVCCGILLSVYGSCLRGLAFVVDLGKRARVRLCCRLLRRRACSLLQLFVSACVARLSRHRMVLIYRHVCSSSVFCQCENVAICTRCAARGRLLPKVPQISEQFCGFPNRRERP